MKRLLKILLYSFGAILILVLVLLALMQTSWFKDFSKDQILSIANEQLNGKLSIGKIEGTVLGSLQFTEIEIQQGDTSLFYCDKISLDYDLTGIISKSIIINSVVIDSFSIRLVQLNDSLWNFNKILKPSEEIDTSGSGKFNWEIDVNEFRILNSNAAITVIDTSTLIPHRFNEINLFAEALIKPEVKVIKINNFSFISENPDLHLENLFVEAEISDTELSVPKILINTKANKINISGRYFFNNSQESNLRLITEPIHFNEFAEFLPSLKLNGNPILKVSGKYKNNSANIDLSVVDEMQEIILVSNLENLNILPNYIAKLEITKIDIGYWLDDSYLKTNINAKLNIKGEGISVEELNTKADLIVYNSELLKRNLDTLKISSSISEGNIKNDLWLKSEFGNLSGIVKVKDFDTAQNFDIKSSVNNLNLSPILLDSSLVSNLTFNFSALGSGFNPNKMNGSFFFNVDSSSVNSYEIDSLKSFITINDGVYRIDKFNFGNNLFSLNMQGKFSLAETNDISFNLITKDVSKLPQLSNFENVNINGGIRGEIYGKLDSLTSKINYDFKDISLSSDSINKINGEIRILKIRDAISANLKSQIENTNISGTNIDRIDLEGEYSNNRIQSDLSIMLDENNSANITSIVNIDSSISVIIPHLKLVLSDSVWSNPHDSVKINIGDDSYKIENFTLSNGNQNLKVSGEISPDSNNLSLSLDSLKIAQFLEMFDEQNNTSATINANLKVKGTTELPAVNGELNLTDLTYDNILLGDIVTQFILKDEILNWDFELDNNGNKIVSEGYLPLIVNADSSQSIIPGDRQFNAKLKIDSLALNKIAVMVEQVDQIDGTVKSDLTLYNTLDNIEGRGYFSIKDINLVSESLGLNYNKANIYIEADGQKFNIRQIEFVNNDGTLKIDGFLGFKGGLLLGDLNQLKLNLEADKFEIANSQNYEAKIDGKLNFFKEGDESIFNGQMEILRSKFYLPYFTNAASGNKYDLSKPILIKELERNNFNDTFYVSTQELSEDSLDQSNFIKNINGEFTLTIPRNTWITSPELNIELSGELDIIKKQDNIELFGNINTVRGKLEIYGKEFKIVEGNIIFNGGKKFNPNLNLILEYMFRATDRTKKYLELRVTGTIENPNLLFSLDGTKIDEGNAISYLFFGKSLDQLTQSQKTEVSNSEADMAKTIAGNFLAAQLSSTVGDALGLNVIEISGNESWSEATLTAGKYLTDDLYVSYERGFGSSETNEVNPKIITMEYQLTKYLYLQLVEGNDKTSGFDAVIKFTW